ncbi:MAG: Hsp20/alpha crystallin family protein [Acidobacteria bacterium]|nr:Hsp20/alpha crystallin family protein [Acidobacteriota bacterium]
MPLKGIPFSDLDAILSEMNSLFERMFSSRELVPQLEVASWSPPVDIYETGEEIVLSAELPGVREEDIKLEIEGNELVISGERRLEEGGARGNWSRMERFYGPFERRFLLPAKVDKERISATLSQGVLEVHLPKLEEKRAKRIAIKIEK